MAIAWNDLKEEVERLLVDKNMDGELPIEVIDFSAATTDNVDDLRILVERSGIYIFG